MSPLAGVGKELVELRNRARILEKHHDGRAIEPIRETPVISPGTVAVTVRQGTRRERDLSPREGVISVNILSTAERNTRVHFNQNPQRAGWRIEAETAGVYFRRPSPIQPEFQNSRRDES
jgi:hypothetical protein